MSCGDVFLGVIAIFFPPIAVWIKAGLCSADSLINILLCMLGYIPGLIHAWYIIAKYPEPDHEYESVNGLESGQRGGPRVTYYYVSHESAPGSRQHQQQRTYGTQQQNRSTNKSVSSTQWQGSSQSQRQESGTTRVEGSSRQPHSQPPQQPAGPSSGAGRDEEGAPPSYSDAVKADNKIQTRD